MVLGQTFLSFRVAEAGYAVPVAAVREIVRLEKSFEMPDVPAHVRGVINLRGRVIPLIDVRARFGRPTRPFDDRTVTVVLDVEGTSVGLVVDDVSEVVELPPGAREPLQHHHGPAAGMVTEAAKRADGLLFVLDLARLVEPRPHP